MRHKKVNKLLAADCISQNLFGEAKGGGDKS